MIRRHSNGTLLVHRIALDTKVGYLLVTYTLRSSLRNDRCVQKARFVFSTVLPQKHRTPPTVAVRYRYLDLVCII